MDLLLQIADDLVLDKVWAKLVPLSTPEQFQALNSSITIPTSFYASVIQPLPLISAWPREYIPRQIISLIILTTIGIHILYFLFAWLSYKFIFNHDMMRHPRFLKDQIKLEIQCSLRAFPGMTILTLPWFQAEVMGYSRLYDGLDTYGYFYLFASIPLLVSSSWSERTFAEPVTGSCFSPITAFIGSTGGYIFLYYTKLCTNHTISGSVCSFISLYISSVDAVCLSSPNTLRFTCFPRCRWVPAICTLPPIHLHISPPSGRISLSLYSRQRLEHPRVLYF